MKKIAAVISIIWFLLISISSPVWIGIIYMYLSGHGKEYGYNMSSEADIAVFVGVIALLLWLLAVVPVTKLLCKKCYNKKISNTPPYFFVCSFYNHMPLS